LNNLIGGGKSHNFCRCWFVLQDLIRTRYASHLLHTEFRGTIVGIQKILEGVAAKVDIDSKPPILVKPEIVNKPEPESKVVDEPENVAELVPVQEKISLQPTEVEELSIDTLVDFLAEPTIELFLPAMMFPSLFMRSLDCLRPIADISTRDRITGDQSTHGAKCSPFSVHHG